MGKAILFFMLQILLSIKVVYGVETSQDRDYRQPHSDRGLWGQVDKVDPYNGNLIVTHTDINIPGNGGLDISIKRIYNFAATSAALTATYARSYKWTALGPGWSLRAAPRLVFDNVFDIQNDKANYISNSFKQLCGTEAMGLDAHDQITLEQPDGSDEVVFFEAGHGVTKNNWKVTCESNIVTAYSPDGVKFEFGNISNSKIGKYSLQMLAPAPGPGTGGVTVIGNTRTVSYLDAIKATNPNGEWISYGYTMYGTPIAISIPSNNNGRILFGADDDKSTEKPSSLLTSITASDGRNVALVYNMSTGKLSSINDGAGLIWTYEYISADSNTSYTLSKVTRPDGEKWEYTYVPGAFRYGTQDMIKPVYTYINSYPTATPGTRRLSSIKYPHGGVINYTYNYLDLQANGNSTAYYLRVERVASRTFSNGYQWLYSYNRGGTGAYDITTINGPEGVEIYKYIGAGYAISTTGLLWQNNAWRVGSLVEHEYANGAREYYVWQRREIFPYRRHLKELGMVWDEKIWFPDMQKRTVERDGATYTTEYSNYDAYGNPGTIVETGLNGGNRTTTRTYLNDTGKWIIGRLKDESFTGSSTTRTFDANGNLTNITKEGVSTSYTYDSAGNVATATMPRGLVYSFSNYKRGIPQTENQPEGVNITRVVDAAGNITSETNGAGKTTTYTYDGLNRVTSVTTPLGNPKTTTYTATSKTTTRGSLIETTQYDPFGRVASITLGGITTSYAYDALGRRTFESNPGATIGTTYQYDALNRVTKIINADNTFQTHAYGAGTKTVTDERNNATTYAYRAYGDPDKQYLMGVTTPISSASVTLARNSKDLITSATQGGLTRTYGYDSRYYLTTVVNPETGTTTYGRDAAGNMTSLTVGSSGTTSYTYDGRNRLSVVTYPNPLTTPTVTHTYTLTDKPLSVSSSAATKGFIYDDNGNLKKETLTVDSIPFVTEYIYNANDQIASMIYPRSGQQVNYVPDVLGRPTQVSGYISAVTYWPSGLMKQINYANGVVTNYEQQARLWPSTFTTKKGAVAYSDSSYTYDEVGNLKAIVDSADTSFNVALDYDNLNRVVSHTNPIFISTIAYDGAGNILNRTYSGVSSNYNYDSYNRLASITGYLPTTYAYDAYGNIAAGTGNTYSYDDASNLACINCSDTANKIQYGYDGSKSRVTVIKAGVKSYEVYGAQGTQLVEYTPSQSQKLIEYIYLGGKRVAQRVTTQ
ncbi:DUF6531 domain-containing protein [Methylovorus menthalis]|uniref:DUF6531 domain-containing protein n=1 Tax=Methylovorus menthalis TaxID=1002227 RepID=UPI001E2DD5A9|nr:DUF6531 domain-containing protein [Methylovorus menthalis]MCB4811060.1 DUF6531 domain-containing protein [Methylovorus menthalis]